MGNFNIEVPIWRTNPINNCFDQRLVPKKIKTATSNVQTDPIKKPDPPLMKSQSVNIQIDLPIDEPKTQTSPKKKDIK